MTRIVQASLHRLGRGLRGAPTAACDGRGRRVVAVIECVLNQNARDAGAARFEAVNVDMLKACARERVGLVQMPCPEVRHLGIARARPPGCSIREALDTDAGRRSCDAIAAEVADRLRAYADAGCEIVAVIGGNERSPGCAVHASSGRLGPRSGVLMRSLQRQLRDRGLDPPFMALRDDQPESLAVDLQEIETILARGVFGR